LVPSSRVLHTFMDKNNTVVLGDQRTRLGVTDFCVRMVCEISASSSGRRSIVISYVILIFPAAAMELEDTPESKRPGWPGVALTEGTFPLGPKPSTPWGCPCTPFIRPAAPYAEDPTAPSSNRLRAAIAAVMRKAGQPDVRPNGRNATNRWATIRANPRELVALPPDITWPPAELPADQGEYSRNTLHYINLDLG
jgi:hypothetical protein